MTAAYVPQQGDRVRLADWAPDEYVDVEYTNDVGFYGLDDAGDPIAMRFDLPWLKVEKPRPLPERWLTVDHVNGAVNLYYSEAGASDRPHPHDTFRVWSDEDGEPRIERVVTR